MKNIVISSMVLAAALAASPALAQQVQEQPQVQEQQIQLQMQRQRGNEDRMRAREVSIFAYPGTKCPGGTRPYRGPEVNEPVADGAIFCLFEKKYVAFPKGPRCPGNMQKYTGSDANVDATKMWCQKVTPQGNTGPTQATPAQAAPAQ